MPSSGHAVAVRTDRAAPAQRTTPRSLSPTTIRAGRRTSTAGEVRVLAGLLARLDLRPVDLATAVAVGADRFITSSQRDFPQTITEIDITYPADLTDPGT
jgi:hypothetical protein